MAFPYKHILVVGATAGIGAAMADHFITHGIKVTAVGRRAERLDSFVKKHGAEKASSVVFDISKLSDIPAFAEETLKTHPSIDAIFLNAGIQEKHNFANPSTCPLPTFHDQINVNFTAQVSLTHAFLPHLLSQSGPAALLYTGTNLSLVPAFPMPAYSASKAALDAFIVCIREQLSPAGVKVFHLSPGPVQTELHGETMDDERAKAFGMPVEQFVEEAWKGLGEGTLDVFIGQVGGSSKEQFLEIVEKRDAAVERLTGLMRKFGM